MNYMERKQIAYLQKQKEELVNNFIGACEQINQQIKDVKAGIWVKEMELKNETDN